MRLRTGLRGGARAGPSLSRAPVGRGDATFGNPHRAQIVQFELFERILLLKFDTVPCRAIRGNSLSVNSTFPPLNLCFPLSVVLRPALRTSELCSLGSQGLHGLGHVRR